MTGQRGRAEGKPMSAAAAALHGAPTRRLGSRLGLGAARCRGGQAGAAGRAGPHHTLAPSPSSFVQGTDHRKMAGWCWRWECGSLWGKKGGTLHWGILQNVPFQQGLRGGGPSFRFPSCSTSYSRTASSSTVATRSHFHLNEVTLSKMRKSIPQVH